jgi:glucokinase
MLIAGDIGGTKTQLAVFSQEEGLHRPLTEARFTSADYPSLGAIIKEFLAKAGTPLDRACFAVAGPVIGGRVKTTNLPWMVEETALAQALNLDPKSVQLINDLEAIARAVPFLRPTDIQTLNAGEPVAPSGRRSSDSLAPEKGFMCPRQYQQGPLRRYQS